MLNWFSVEDYEIRDVKFKGVVFLIISHFESDLNVYLIQIKIKL